MPKPKGWTKKMLEYRDRLARKLADAPGIGNPWAVATARTKERWRKRYGWKKRRGR